MDFLGKEGEKAAEAVENLSGRLEDLESHINAVDSAVQDLDTRMDSSIESIRQESRQTDLEIAQENRERLEDLEQLLMRVTDIQKNNLRRVRAEDGGEQKLEKKYASLNEKLRRTRESQKEIENKLEMVEKKIYDVEDELDSSTSLNKNKIQSRVTETRFEREIKSLKKEISRLKASMNSISDEVVNDSIRTE